MSKHMINKRDAFLRLDDILNSIIEACINSLIPSVFFSGKLNRHLRLNFILEMRISLYRQG